MQIQARHYRTGESIRLSIADGQITSLEPATDGGSSELFVAPGLFDLQINGYGGVWFSNAALTPDDVGRTLRAHYQFGLTRLCPTLITASHESLRAGFEAIHQACETDAELAAMVPGCHLEGPWISPEDGPRGAHPLPHVRPPDRDEFFRLQEAAGGRICLVTLSPEHPGVPAFIEALTRENVTVAIGHTAADSDQIAAAVDAGARLSTHLGNGAHPRLPRHPNYIWDQLADPRLTASIITDGFHLPQNVIRCVIGIKSIERTVITCDAAGLAGCPPGPYDIHEVQVEVLESGRIVVAGQDTILAGSGASTAECVAHVVRSGAASLPDAVDMAGRVPARLLGFEPAELAVGRKADMFLFRSTPSEPLQVVRTIASGVVRFGGAQSETA